MDESNSHASSPNASSSRGAKSIAINVSLSYGIFKRLQRLADSKGVNEQDLVRLFTSMGLDLAEGNREDTK